VQLFELFFCEFRGGIHHEIPAVAFFSAPDQYQAVFPVFPDPAKKALFKFPVPVGGFSKTSHEGEPCKNNYLFTLFQNFARDFENKPSLIRDNEYVLLQMTRILLKAEKPALQDTWVLRIEPAKVD